MTTGDRAMDSRKTDFRVDPAKPRRPYVKPAFGYERVFETTALACADKDPGGDFFES